MQGNAGEGNGNGSPSVVQRAMRAFGSRDSLNSIASGDRKVFQHQLIWIFGEACFERFKVNSVAF